MRPFQGPLDTSLDSPFSASLSVHGLHFTVCVPSICPKFCPILRPESQTSARVIKICRRYFALPEGPARHLDASRQKLTPHCLAAIFDSQLPSPKLSLQMPPKLPLPHNRGHFFLFQNCPRGEGNCAAIERQKLSRGNFCLAASRCLCGPFRSGACLGNSPMTT